MECLFCKIVEGEIDSHVVYEDEKCLVILDINPHSKGHVLVIPKEHTKIFVMSNPEIMSHMLKITYLYSKLIEKEFNKSTTISIQNGGAAGQNIQHASIQIIPGNVFNLKKNKENSEEIFEKIKKIVHSSFD